MKRLSAIIIFFLIVLTGLANAKTQELDVYRDWRGNNCEFVAERPFFIISDIYDLQNFWQKCNSDEQMPGIDFDKYMLFVWAPGSSMIDQRNISVDKFLKKDGKYVVILNSQKKHFDSGWKKPFVATMLPKKEKGDLFVMRNGNKFAGESPWMPLYTLWDMSGDRVKDFETVKYEAPPVKKPQFISHSPRELAELDQPAAVKNEQNTKPVVVSRPSASKPVNVASRPRPQAATAPKRPVPVAKAESKRDEFGGSGLFDSVPSSKSSATVKSRKSVVPPASNIEENPLFGEEFDIKF